MYILTIHIQDRSKTVKAVLTALGDIVKDANAPAHPLFGNMIDLDVIDCIAHEAYVLAQKASAGRLGVSLEFARTTKSGRQELEIFKINLPADTILTSRNKLKVRPSRELIATVREAQ